MAVSPTEIREWTIYKITSPSNRVYIGVTSDLIRRKRSYSGMYCKSQPVLYNSIKKYGFKYHSFEIIDSFTSTISYAHDKEMFWIRSFMSNGFKYPEQQGMNRTDGGQGTLGCPKTEAEKIASSKRNKGYRHTEEAKRKISEASIGNKHNEGRKHTEERKKKISNFFKGNKYNIGRKQSPEVIENRVSKIRGLKRSNEQKERYSQSFIKLKGKPIVQYDLTGSFIKEYPAINVAARELGIKRENIKDALLQNKNNRYKAFIFKYKQP